MKLQDIFAVEEWDKLLGSFKTVVGIAPLTIDAEGGAVTSPCFTCEACQMIKSTPEGARRCKEGHVQMVKEARESRKALIKLCHAKFLKVTIPIFKGDEFLGVTGGCNIMPENAPADDTFFHTLASEIGVNGDDLARAARKAKRVRSAIIEMQIQTLMLRIKTKMSQVEQAQSKPASSP
ncbi:MAG TPA: PocR ligand-binding domain-containing protein [Spirochaetia bacterium]|nr:PocR ligand-binding domain-containing protein [Spirochaetia bacterium]